MVIEPYFVFRRVGREIGDAAACTVDDSARKLTKRWGLIGTAVAKLGATRREGIKWAGGWVGESGGGGGPAGNFHFRI